MIKSSPRLLAKLVYVLLFLMTGAAIAILPATATNFLPDANAGALFLIIPVTILLLTLVIEVWRETGKGARTLLDQQLHDIREKRLGR